MDRRQTRPPQQWLIVDERLEDQLWAAMKRLPPGHGVLVLYHGIPKRERQHLLTRLRRIAQARQLMVVDEANGEAARVHSVRELRRALLAHTPLILLSPLFPTRTHPGWRPIPRMRAAALARLGRRRLLALGGMDARRFRQVQPLGFRGWAAIDAFRT